MALFMKKKGKYTAQEKDEMLELAYHNKPIQITDNRMLGIVAALLADGYLGGYHDGRLGKLYMTPAGRNFYDKGGYQGAEDNERKEKIRKTLADILLVVLSVALSAIIGLLIG